MVAQLPGFEIAPAVKPLGNTESALIAEAERSVAILTRLKGIGVGLSLVARFAELHGGSAWVQDHQGGGASFRVLLPES